MSATAPCVRSNLLTLQRSTDARSSSNSLDRPRSKTSVALLLTRNARQTRTPRLLRRPRQGRRPRPLLGRAKPPPPSRRRSARRRLDWSAFLGITLTEQKAPRRRVPGQDDEEAEGEATENPDASDVTAVGVASEKAAKPKRKNNKSRKAREARIDGATEVEETAAPAEAKPKKEKKPRQPRQQPTGEPSAVRVSALQ